MRTRKEMTGPEAALHFRISTRQLDRRRKAGDVEAYKVDGHWVYAVDVEAAGQEPSVPAVAEPSVLQEMTDTVYRVGQLIEARTAEQAAAIGDLNESIAMLAPLLKDMLQVELAERARLQSEVDQLKGELARRRTPWWKRRKSRQ